MFSDFELRKIVDWAEKMLDEAERWRFHAGSGDIDPSETILARQRCMTHLQSVYFAVESWSVSMASDAHWASLERCNPRLRDAAKMFASSARHAMNGLRSRAVDAGEADPDWRVVDNFKRAVGGLVDALGTSPGLGDHQGGGEGGLGGIAPDVHGSSDKTKSPVELRGQDQEPIILGHAHPRINQAQYKVIEFLCEKYPKKVGLDEMKRNAGDGSPTSGLDTSSSIRRTTHRPATSPNLAKKAVRKPVTTSN